MTAIGLVAHDEKKAAMVAWVTAHRAALKPFAIFSTGTTGGRIREACAELDVTPLKSGPLGGDQQLGAMIAEGRLQALVFFIDPLSPHPHDVDIKALIRIAALNDIPLAVNQASADMVLAGLKA